MKLLLNITLFLLLITNIFVVKAESGSYQAPPTATLTIDKKVLLPNSEKGTDGQWLDTIGHDQYRFTLGEAIYFQVTIHNPTSASIDSITFTDRSPWSVDLSIEGASYDSSTNSYTITVGKLDAGESKTFQLAGTIRTDARSLPYSTLSCADNYAFVSAQGTNYDDDSSNFCIKRDLPKVVPITRPPHTIPSTGAPLLFPLLGLAGAMFATGKKLIDN